MKKSDLKNNGMIPYVVGIWRDDPCKVPQGYEFGTWAEALDFCKRNRKTFEIWSHGLLPGRV